MTMENARKFVLVPPEFVARMSGTDVHHMHADQIANELSNILNKQSGTTPRDIGDAERYALYTHNQQDYLRQKQFGQQPVKLGITSAHNAERHW